MTRHVALLGIAVFLLLGCASKDFAEPGVISGKKRSTGRTFSGSYSSVWNATLEALQAKKYPITLSQREGGVIVTNWISGKSDRLYSGYGETRIPYKVRSKFSLQLRPSREGVAINIDNEEEYYSDSVTAGIDFSGSLYQWIPTKSSTKKEAAILDEIETQLAKGTGTPETP